MLRALLWKEWRTHRPQLAAAVAIAVLLPALLLAVWAAASSRKAEDVAMVAGFVITVCVWPMYAALTGAMIFGQEVGDGSLRFLLSRPVSRSRLWFVKTASGLAIYIGLLVATGAVAYGFYLLSGGGLPDLSRAPGAGELAAQAALVGALVFLLLCAAYCSLFVHRPLTATLGGAVIAGGIGATATAAWLPLVPKSEYAEAVGFSAGAPIVVTLGVVGIAAATFREFSRADAIREISIKTMLKPLAIVVLAIVAIGAGPVAYVSLGAVATAHAGAFDQHLALVDGAVVTIEVAPNGLTTSIVRIDAFSGERRVLVAGHATAPSVSPDGRWIVYAHFDGYRAELARAFSVRAVRVDGSDDHPVLEGETFSMPEFWARQRVELSIDPGSELVAASTPSGRLVFGALAGGAARSSDIRAAEIFVGWIGGAGAEVLLYDMGRVSGRRQLRLTVLDAETAARRTIGEFAGLPLHSGRAGFFDGSDRRPPGGWRWFPLQLERRVQTGREVALHLAELRPGAAQLRFGQMPGPAADAVPPCPGTGWFADDGERFLYGSRCWSDGSYDMELRVRDLAAGTDEVFATLAGLQWISLVRTSPNGDRLLLHADGVTRGWGTFVVDPGGTPRHLADELMPVGWVDDHNAVLRNASGPGKRLIVVNVDSGARRDIFP